MDDLQNGINLSGKQLDSLAFSKQITKCSAPLKIEHIDLSNNQLKQVKSLTNSRNVKELSKFTQLRTLNLDNNSIEYMEDIPEFSNLDTLSIAYNDLTDIDNLIENVLQKYPLLRYLNLLKNPLNPLLASETQYQRFRQAFLHSSKLIQKSIKSLEMLDGMPLDQIEEKKSPQPRGKKDLGSDLFGDDQPPVRSKKRQEMKEKQGKAMFGVAKNGGKKKSSAPGTTNIREKALKSKSEGNRFIQDSDL